MRDMASIVFVDFCILCTGHIFETHFVDFDHFLRDIYIYIRSTIFYRCDVFMDAFYVCYFLSYDDVMFTYMM